jgi:hypothetical protein
MVEDIAKRVCYILISGGIAENIARHSDFTVSGAQLCLGGSDLTRAAAIAEHFAIDLVIEMKFLYACLKDDRFWRPIDQLANALLASENKRLSRDQICNAMQESGLWEFIAN